MARRYLTIPQHGDPFFLFLASFLHLFLFPSFASLPSSEGSSCAQTYSQRSAAKSLSDRHILGKIIGSPEKLDQQQGREVPTGHSRGPPVGDLW